MQRTLPFLFAAALTLAACGSAAKAGYAITFKVQDPAQRSQLLIMSQNVIQRRLATMGEEATIDDLKATEQGGEIRLTVSDPVIAAALTEQLTQPFTFEVMKEVPLDKADIRVAEHGGFGKTGIDARHLTWVQSANQQGTPLAMVTLSFTPEGRTLMQKVFKENKGKFVGIFVRGVLVSKLKVETDQLKDDIVIQEIPSKELADAFADDVNVGLHAAFAQLP